MAKRYAVVRIDNGWRNPPTGTVSEHDSEDEARAAIRVANAQLRRLAGYATSWHPYAVLDQETGEKL